MDPTLEEPTEADDNGVVFRETSPENHSADAACTPFSS